MTGIATLAALIAAGAKHLGITEGALRWRADRLAHNLAAAGETAVDVAAEQLGQLTLHQFCTLLAEGPTEQTRALLAPEEVHPVAHQGLGGHGAPVAHDTEEEAL